MLEKAGRNKTIDFTVEEGKEYINRCIRGEDVTNRLSDIIGQFIIGDCLEVMDKLPKGFVDLLIVDPPYNLDKDFHGSKFNSKSTDEYKEYTIRWVEKTIQLLKPNASIYVCCDWKSSLVIGDVLKDFFKIQNRITWQREKGRGAKSNWKNGMEDIWYATISNDYTFNLDDVKIRKRVIAPYKENGKPKDWEETAEGNFRNTCPSNFWDDISVPYWSMPENTGHPTQKPEKLIAKMILASSNPGDVVFDPFAGSGTSAVTAKKLNREYVVVEQNELYAAWAQKRLEMADENTSIQGYSDGVFWERNSLQYQKRIAK